MKIQTDALTAVKVARAYEKVALAEARKRAQKMVEEETAEAHQQVLDAIRQALLAGETGRQIGVAYGTSDARTIRRLVSEAMGTDEGGIEGADHPTWKLSKNHDGTFNITAYALGEGQLSGHAVCALDDDGENFTVISGDMWIQIQLYRMGFKEQVIKEATA